jgi:hypothetical protein
LSTDRNSEVGLIRQIQAISGAMGFVCSSLVQPSRYYAKYHADFCWFKAGCGKTVLTYETRLSLRNLLVDLPSKRSFRGYIINYLQTTFSARDDTVIIYYFFDSRNKTTLHTLTFLRCILHQVVRLETLLPDSQRHLESLFVDQIDQAEPDTNELMELFLHFYGKFKNAFLLIDGLDEADKSHQRNVKSFLKAAQKVNGARILAMNHPDLDMSKVFSHCQTLQIKPEDLKSDIEIFVQTQIDEHAQDGLSVCSPSLLDKVRQALLFGAEEMLVRSEQHSYSR